MNNHFFVVGFFISLLLFGCDNGRESKSISPKPTGPAKQANASSEVVRHFAKDRVFPETPNNPVRLPAGPDFSRVDESTLIRTFESGDVVHWSSTLREMAKRKTSKCMRSMADNITLLRGISVISGEWIYSPAHSAPVAIALISCGRDARDALVDAANNPQLDLRVRVLNLWVLKNLDPEGPLLTDWIIADPSSEAERQVLLDMLEIASDESQLSELFPLDVPQS